MKRRFLLALLAPGLVPMLALAQNASPSQPRMEMREVVFSFGDVYHQEKYVHSFPVRNLGVANLEIKAVNPSCGCTAVKFDRVITPGQTGQIELSIDGAKVHGDFEKSAAVESNDSEHPHLVLKVTGREIPYVNIQPEGTLLLEGRFGEPIEQELAVTSNEKDLVPKMKGI